jgi:hypothetical protein
LVAIVVPPLATDGTIMASVCLTATPAVDMRAAYSYKSGWKMIGDFRSRFCGFYYFFFGWFGNLGNILLCIF